MEQRQDRIDQVALVIIDHLALDLADLQVIADLLPVLQEVAPDRFDQVVLEAALGDHHLVDPPAAGLHQIDQVQREVIN